MLTRKLFLAGAFCLGATMALAQDGTSVPDGPGPNLVLEIGGSVSG